MDCPKCGLGAYIINSRLRPDNSRVRRYKCLECLHRFSTVEVIADIKPGRKKEEPKQ